MEFYFRRYLSHSSGKGGNETLHGEANKMLVLVFVLVEPVPVVVFLEPAEEMDSVSWKSGKWRIGCFIEKVDVLHGVAFIADLSFE